MSVVAGSAFVTGGGSGIGRAIAEALAREGAPVAVVDLLPDGAKETVAAIEGAGGKAIALSADVSRWDDVDRAVSTAVRDLGPLGIVVNAAGILDGYATADELSPQVWERVIAIDLTGTFFGAKRALTEMLPRGRGRIINIASVAGLVGDGGGAAYVSAKHGVVGLTRRMATTYADRGITVNAICPGLIDTELARENSTPSQLEGLVSRFPVARLGKPVEVAELLLFLASEGAGFITGAAFDINGGSLMV